MKMVVVNKTWDTPYIDSNLDCGNNNYGAVYFVNKNGVMVKSSTYHIEPNADRPCFNACKTILEAKVISKCEVEVGIYAYRGATVGGKPAKVCIKCFDVNEDNFYEFFAGHVSGRWGYVNGNKNAMMKVAEYLK